MRAQIISDPDKLNQIYRTRYKVFVIEDKDAPPELYPDGILKDAIDDSSIHIGCYENNTLLGFLTVAIKNICVVLPIEEQHEIECEKDSAEVMRLIIINEAVNKQDIALRGKILKLLFSKVRTICQEYRLNYLYLVSTKFATKLYLRLGFNQIGDYKLYKNISLECPMKLNISEVRFKFEENEENE